MGGFAEMERRARERIAREIGEDIARDSQRTPRKRRLSFRRRVKASPTRFLQRYMTKALPWNTTEIDPYRTDRWHMYSAPTDKIEEA